MVSNLSILRALRARLLATVAYDSGLMSIAATGGSYVAQPGPLPVGLMQGMEVEGRGFAAAMPPLVASAVTGDSVAVGPALPEDPSPGTATRRLVVGIPALRAWENVAFNPEDGRWYVEEDYLPGGSRRVTLGKSAEVDVYPVYVIRLYGLSGRGTGAIHTVGDAILNNFRPGADMPTDDGHTVRVMGDPAPSRGQVLPETASHAVTVITIPLWVRTTSNA